MAELIATATLDQLVVGKRSLVSVPDTATIAEALKVMQDRNLVALPVAAPPGKWLGAGAATVVDGDVQYIGLVSMVDFVIHISGKESSVDAALSEPVINLIGESNESMSLWVMSAKTLLLEAMELMSKGVHRVLVAVQSPSPSSDSQRGKTQLYLLTQTDVVRALLQNLDTLGPAVATPIQELGLIYPSLPPVSVSATTPVLEALRIMRQAGGISALPVLDADDQGHVGSEEDATSGVPRRGRVVATLSASDFRGLDVATIAQLSKMQVYDLLRQMSGVGVPRPPVTCRPMAPLAEVMANAITSKVHRVWVTDEGGYLIGVVTFTDMINAAREVFANLAP